MSVTRIWIDCCVQGGPNAAQCALFAADPQVLDGVASYTRKSWSVLMKGLVFVDCNTLKSKGRVHA